jgi:hypothetical protein
MGEKENRKEKRRERKAARKGVHSRMIYISIANAVWS